MQPHVCFALKSGHLAVRLKQTGRQLNAMSVFPPKADMCGAKTNVRYGPIADIASDDSLV